MTTPTATDTANNITTNGNSTPLLSAKSDFDAQADSSSMLATLASPGKNQCTRITRQSLKRINDMLLTPIKPRISERRKTVDTRRPADTRALEVNSSKSKPKRRRDTIDVNPFKTFKLTFNTFKIEPLIYINTKQNDKLPPAPKQPSINDKDTIIKTKKFEPKTRKRHSNILQALRNAEVLPSKMKHKAPPKAKPNKTEQLLKSTKPANRPHKCDVCGKSYRVLFDLISHKSHHTGMPAYPCKMCDYHCSNIKTIRKHFRNIHNSVFSLK